MTTMIILCLVSITAKFVICIGIVVDITAPSAFVFVVIKVVVVIMFVWTCAVVPVRIHRPYILQDIVSNKITTVADASITTFLFISRNNMSAMFHTNVVLRKDDFF